MNGPNGHLNALLTPAGAPAPAGGATARSASAPAGSAAATDATSFAAVLAGRQGEATATSAPKAGASSLPGQASGQTASSDSKSAQQPAGDLLDGSDAALTDPLAQGSADAVANAALIIPATPAGSDLSLPGLGMPIATDPVNASPINAGANVTSAADNPATRTDIPGADASLAPVIASIQNMGRDVLQPRDGTGLPAPAGATQPDMTGTTRPDGVLADAGQTLAKSAAPDIAPSAASGKPAQTKTADTQADARQAAATDTATNAAANLPGDGGFVSARTRPDQPVEIAQITTNAAAPKPVFVLEPGLSGTSSSAPAASPSGNSAASPTVPAPAQSPAQPAVPAQTTPAATPPSAAPANPAPVLADIGTLQPSEPRPVSPVSVTLPDAMPEAQAKALAQPAAAAKAQAGQNAPITAQPNIQTNAQANAPTDNGPAKPAASVSPQTQTPAAASTPAASVAVSAQQAAPAMTPLSPLRQAGQAAEPVIQSAPGEQVAKRSAKSAINAANPAASAIAKAAGAASPMTSTTAPAASATAMPDLAQANALPQTPLSALPLGPETAPAPVMADSASLASLDVDLTTGRVDGRGAIERSGGEPARFTPQSAAQLAAQITRKFNNGARVFDIRLDPAELGRVDVKLELSADQRVQAVLTAERPETLAELQRAARELERALNEAGLQLGENGLSFELGQQAGEGAGDRDGQPGSAQDVLGASLLNEDDVAREDPDLVNAYGFDLMRRDRIDMRI